jgi:hypothetical protein
VPPPANKELTFIDFIPKFREMAQQIYNKCLAVNERRPNFLIFLEAAVSVDGDIFGKFGRWKHNRYLMFCL